MIKPEGVKRRLVGKIIARFEEKGLYLVQSRVTIPTMDILREHYAEHVKKDFFPGMAKAMSSSQVVPMVWEGENAVAVARKLIGATNPMQSEMGTIRGDYAMAVGRNIIHGADSPEAAEREIKIWFGEHVPSVIEFDRESIYE